MMLLIVSLESLQREGLDIDRDQYQQIKLMELISRLPVAVSSLLIIALGIERLYLNYTFYFYDWGYVQLLLKNGKHGYSFKNTDVDRFARYRSSALNAAIMLFPRRSSLLIVMEPSYSSPALAHALLAQ